MSDKGVTSQENVGKNGLVQGLGEVWEFHFESGKIYIFERSQGKVKFQVNMMLFILFWLFLW